MTATAGILITAVVGGLGVMFAVYDREEWIYVCVSLWSLTDNVVGMLATIGHFQQ